MSAEAVTAACAAVIALLALIVSGEQMRTARVHNRKSVRPILRFASGYVDSDVVGLRVKNVGLGPAIVLRSEIWLDRESLGSFSREVADRLRQECPLVSIRTATIEHGSILENGFTEDLLSASDFEWGRTRDMDFFNLIHSRLRLQINYESIYGGESFNVEFPRTD